MKDELQTKLAEILTVIQADVAKGADFAMEQLPDIAQQYVLYGRVWSAIAVLATLALTVFIAWGTVMFGYLGKQTNKYGGMTEERMAAAALGTIAFVPAALTFLVTLHDLAFVWLAPKVWLIKEVAGLLK